MMDSSWLVLVGSIIGACIGGAIGAWVQGFFTEKGKRLATRQDVEHIVNEVQKVTHATETIKAEISSDRWLRQQMWQEKWKLYNDILKLAARLIKSVSFYSAVWGSGDSRSQKVYELEVRSCTETLILKTSEVWLFASEPFRANFETFVDQVKQFPIFDSNDPKDLSADFIDLFLERAINIARDDLKVTDD